MNIWKLGCKWGTDAPNFYSFIKKKQIVIGVWQNEYKPGDLVLLTDGFSGIAIAKLIGAAQPVTDHPELEADFERLEIPYDEDLFTAPVICYELAREDRLWYKVIAGICQINQDHIWDSVLNLYTEFEKMQVINDAEALLKAKGQIVLQGPPGTGKTRLAKLVAKQLTTDEDDYKLIQFHPAYAYEDFVRGIVAETTGGTINYVAENKVLGDFAQKAQANPGKSYVLIIDEINRANLPSVLGELIYALEYRGENVESVYGLGAEKNRALQLPKNLFIIGTMNTADRSVGHMDYAIRRRFAFVSVLPDVSVVPEGPARKLFTAVQDLFTNNLSPEFQAKDVQPGHSYFLVSDAEGLSLKQKLDYELKPLLQEYLKDGILMTSAQVGIDILSA